MTKKEKVEMITAELDRVSKIEALTLTDGGKLLFNSLMKDIVSNVETLTVKYSSLTQMEFISICAEMKTKLDLARAMNKAPKNKDIAQKDLEEALLEEE